MPSAADELRAAIAAAPGGAIPFEEYMRLALYGEHGFYTRPVAGGAGRRRDFLTSPEVGPLFGAVIANMLDGEWVRLGQPDPFTVIELGAGPGALARAVLAAAPRCSDAMRYVAVELAASQRAAHPVEVASASSIEDWTASDATTPGEVQGVLFANELLDNLPFALAVFDGGWREAYVTVGHDGELAEVLSAPFDPVPDVLPSRPMHGARAPLQRRAAAMVEDSLAVLTAGACYVVDYCRTTAEVSGLDWRRWLRTYRGHERGGHYLADPGAVDITSDVMLDQLPAPSEVSTQVEFLARWGIDALIEEGKRAWHAAAMSAPTLATLRMRSRVAEGEALLEPNGLGGFTVACWRR